MHKDVEVQNSRPIDGAALLCDLMTFIKRYVFLAGDSEPVALALYVLHTYAIEAAEATSYVVVTSAEKRSGKTRLLEVLSLLVARPWLATGASEAVLFRKIEQDCPTLLIDESDALFGTYSERTEPIRAVLNSGNRQGGSVPRCVPPNHHIRDFSVFCPKVIAGIDTGRLPDTVVDRGFVIRLKRKADEPVERYRRAKALREAEELCVRAEQWARENADDLREAEPDVPEALDDRAAEAWEPLLAIADRVGGDWPRLAREAAIELSGDEDAEDDSTGVLLLGHIRAAFDRGSDALSTRELLDALKEIEEAPWKTWGSRRSQPGLTPNDLARLLKPFDIRSRTVRIGPEETRKGYKREQFEDAWSRYPSRVDDVEDDELED